MLVTDARIIQCFHLIITENDFQFIFIWSNLSLVMVCLIVRVPNWLEVDMATNLMGWPHPACF